jgi:hypothetical protein
MSQPDPSKKAGATFTWVLGAFAGFAVLFVLIQGITDSKQGFDPREEERHKNTAEILKAQADNIAKLGLNDAKKKEAVFKTTLSELAKKKEGTSTQVVPGSPTNKPLQPRPWHQQPLLPVLQPLLLVLQPLLLVLQLQHLLQPQPLPFLLHPQLLHPPLPHPLRPSKSCRPLPPLLTRTFRPTIFAARRSTSR